VASLKYCKYPLTFLFQVTKDFHVKTVHQDLLDHPEAFTLGCANLVSVMDTQHLAILKLGSVMIVGTTQLETFVRIVHQDMKGML